MWKEEISCIQDGIDREETKEPGDRTKTQRRFKKKEPGTKNVSCLKMFHKNKNQCMTSKSVCENQDSSEKHEDV